MQAAVPVGAGAMAAIIGLEQGDVEAASAAAGCQIANDNGGGQLVISGMGELHLEVMVGRIINDHKCNVKTGRPNTSFPVNGSVKVLWDDDGIYLGFDVKDQDVIGGFKKKDKDPHLWTKDTVEVMVDPDGDGPLEPFVVYCDMTTDCSNSSKSNDISKGTIARTATVPLPLLLEEGHRRAQGARRQVHVAVRGARVDVPRELLDRPRRRPPRGEPRAERMPEGMSALRRQVRP